MTLRSKLLAILTLVLVTLCVVVLATLDASRAIVRDLACVESALEGLLAAQRVTPTVERQMIAAYDACLKDDLRARDDFDDLGTEVRVVLGAWRAADERHGTTHEHDAYVGPPPIARVEAAWEHAAAVATASWDLVRQGRAEEARRRLGDDLGSLLDETLDGEIEAAVAAHLAELDEHHESLLMRIGATPWAARRGREQIHLAQAAVRYAVTVASVDALVTQHARRLTAAVAWGDAQQLREAEARADADSIFEEWRRVLALQMTLGVEGEDEDLAQADQVTRAYRRLTEIGARATTLARAGRRDDARAVLMTEMEPLVDDLTGVRLPALVRDGRLETEEAHERLRGTMTRATLTGGLGAAAVCLLVAVVLVRMVRRTLADLRRLEQGTKALAEGALEHRIEPVGQDELGRLAGSFNEMAGELARSRRGTECVRARTEAILRSLGEALFVADAGGRIELANPAASRLIGSDRTLVGRSLPEVLRARFDLPPRTLDRLVADGGSAGVDAACLADDGRRVPMLLTSSELRDDTGAVTGTVCVAVDVTRRKELEDTLRRQQELERLLFRELNHRVRNNLASLVALVEMTERSNTDVRSFAESIRGRISAMAAVHSSLSDARRTELGIARIVHGLTPAERQSSVELDGPPVRLDARQATAFGMVVHELLTNSLKHGALSVPDGRARIAWEIVEHQPAGTLLKWSWRERGGPPVDPAAPPGVGTTIIAGLVRSDLQGTASLRLGPEGVDHRFTMLLVEPIAETETGRIASSAA